MRRLCAHWPPPRLRATCNSASCSPRPLPSITAQVWDKDQTKPDDLIATSDVTLSESGAGSITMGVKGVDGQDDVPALSFSYEMTAVEEDSSDVPEEVKAERKPVAKPSGAKAGKTPAGPAKPASSGKSGVKK